MVKRKNSGRPGNKRRGRGSGQMPVAVGSSTEFLPRSPATGVRLLRERVEAGGASKPASANLLDALNWLEAEYQRLQSAHALHRETRWPQSAGDTNERVGRAASKAAAVDPAPRPGVNFIPTPPEMVDAMLEAARVVQDDIVYDLGCGDGRIVIAAARRYGAKGVGIDIDPQRIREATARAKEEGVSDRVTFRQDDFFQSDTRDATVVTLYLLPNINLALRPRLLAQLRPGTRVVSHAFDMGDWPPDQTIDVSGRRMYLWLIPGSSA